MLKIGESYLIRTASYYYTGRLLAMDRTFLKLADAAWIPDTGRWADALKNGTFNEIEPYPGEVMVARKMIVDICVWPHVLPRTQK